MFCAFLDSVVEVLAESARINRESKGISQNEIILLRRIDQKSFYCFSWDCEKTHQRSHTCASYYLCRWTVTSAVGQSVAADHAGISGVGCCLDALQHFYLPSWLGFQHQGLSFMPAINSVEQDGGGDE